MSFALKATTKIINLPLPYDIRRLAFRAIRPQDFAYYQRLRNDGEKGSVYSLRGYIENKCIFVHIPKCAGISICQSLFGNHGGSHMGIRQYQLAFSKAEFNEFFKFTFVRNPWDRLYSAYQFLSAGGLSKIDKNWFEQNLSKYDGFNSFVIEWLNADSIFSYPHFAPQHYFLENCHNKIEIDFIGRFEALEEGFTQVCHALDIRASLKKKNITADRLNNYKQAYNDDSIDKVRSIYEKDIRIFNYSFRK